jgi:phosphoserine/homoserine phosphotransferase
LERRAPKPTLSVLALDLESVLIPEIWQTVAAVANVPDLAATTRECADYDMLMQRRIGLCRENGLTLPRLLEIVGAMEPFPGAVDFLAWAQPRALVVIVSDTFHELAGPIVAKLGDLPMLCNKLKLDADGFIVSYEMRDSSGKAGAVAGFQRLGLRVFAVGDSFNDLAMLEAADGAALFRPARRVLESGARFPSFSTFEQLQAALKRELGQDEQNGQNNPPIPSSPVPQPTPLDLCPLSS